MTARLRAGVLVLAVTAGAPLFGWQTSTIKGADLELLEAVRGIAGDVARLRGQSFDRPPIAVRAPDMMRQVAAEIRAFNVLSSERLAARGRSWVDLGLGEETAPATLYTLLAADVSGIGFDPEGNRLLVDPAKLAEKDLVDKEERAVLLMATGRWYSEPLVAHVLMHVRQRERGGSDWLARTTDEILARAAWAEGESNLVALRYLFAGMGLADEILRQPLDPGEYLDGNLVPPSYGRLSGPLAGLVSFVYEDGFVEASRVYLEGGWQAIDAAIVRGRTCADLIDPQRQPGSVAFETPAAPGEGLELADEDSLGQQVIFVLLATLTGKDNLALQSADGWRGDRLYRWEADDGSGMTEWVSHWSSEDAAADFGYGIGRALAARFPSETLQQPGGGVRLLRAAGRDHRVEQQGRMVRVTIAPTPPPE